MRSLLVTLGLALAAPAVLIGLSGCAGGGLSDSDPAELYKEAEQDIENDRYQLAVDKLRIIRNKHPYSRVAVDAQLRLADVYFLQESYGEAALAYEAFKDLHPKHARVSYAMYRIGESWYNDAPDVVARDLTSMQKALDAANDFLVQYPSAPEAPKAQQLVIDARKALSEKELYIANFYFIRDMWEPAIGRYRKILERYGDTEAAKVADKNLAVAERKAEIEKREREEEEARRAAEESA